MEKREPLMEQAYFDEWVAFTRENLADMEATDAAVPATPANRARYRFSIFRETCEHFILRYSQGEPVASLAELFPRVVESFEAYEPVEGKRRLNFREDFDDYQTALWLVSLALLFEADDELFGRLLSLIGNEGRDQLYERLVAARVADRRPAQELLYPEPYRLLLDAADAPAGAGAARVAEFLRVWYPSMKDAYWHETHRKPKTGAFFGYWCFEAAGAVKAFGLDDATFRELRYYPKDLAAHGRAG